MSTNPKTNRANPNRIGRIVRIMGGMPEFIGHYGRISGIEDGMYRVHLNRPVFIPGVGTVFNDLWEGQYLRTVQG